MCITTVQIYVIFVAYYFTQINYLSSTLLIYLKGKIKNLLNAPNPYNWYNSYMSIWILYLYLIFDARILQDSAKHG